MGFFIKKELNMWDRIKYLYFIPDRAFMFLGRAQNARKSVLWESDS